MFQSMTDNSNLYISSTNIKNCYQVAEYMRQCKIKCNVVSNESVVYQDNKYLLEKGCQIKLVNHPPSLINPLFWNNLKSKFKLECAYLEVEGKYKGCIYDYFLKSQCPGNNLS